MWRDKSSEEKPKPTVSANGSLLHDSDSINPQLGSVVGASMWIEGSIKANENITILGKFKGEVVVINNNLVIGRSGRVKGNVVAETIRIEGELQGDGYARQIIISEEGVMRGNITSPRVELKDGSKFKGSIDMDAKAIDQKLKPCRGTAAERAYVERTPKIMSIENIEKNQAEGKADK